MWFSHLLHYDETAKWGYVREILMIAACVCVSA